MIHYENNGERTSRGSDVCLTPDTSSLRVLLGLEAPFSAAQHRPRARFLISLPRVSYK